MRYAAALIALVAALAVSGCGGGDSLDETGQPIVSDVELTPAGTRDFVLVGTTGIFFNTAPAAVETPTLLRFTRFPSTVGLVAPVPQGLGFVGAAEIQRVEAPQETAVAAPVILRIPPVRSLPEGRRLLILVADTADRSPEFQSVVDTTGVSATGVVQNGMVQFEVTQLGSFLVAEDIQQ
ncbi:MAG: hypothetical protein HYX78_15495 [Armatimonadetes bacterium]|nr:hypothetical protein [Armatimonadota bacterium]